MSLAYDHVFEYTGLCVDPQFIPTLFPHIKKWLASSRAATGHSFDEQAALQDFINRDVLLWLAMRGSEIVGVVTTRLIKGHDNKVCLITGLAGTGMAQWLHLLEVIEQYARDEGCARVRLEGRMGWRRALSDYHQIGVILERTL